MNKQRSVILDALKGIAIIAVALYHFGGGILPYGYLGVDIFFVVGGYLFVRNISRLLGENKFNYWKFLFRKIVRLWPLIILAAIVAVGVGYFLMLPDDYENLAESAIASSAFAENILRCITTKNYWDVVNHYKPLMHLWYVGVLMQAYVVLPLIYMFTQKLKISVKTCTIGLTVLSLGMFLLPVFSTAWKFYYLPFRVFEITAGGVLIYIKPIKNKKPVAIVSGVLLMLLLASRWEFISGSVMLLATVIATMFFLNTTMEMKGGRVIAAFASVGKRSYSIYIWHQVIVAFLAYSLFQHESIQSLVVFIVLTALLSIMSYKFIELPLSRTIAIKKKEAGVIVGGIVLAIVLCGFSFNIYCHAGVVRDVPELGISKDNVHRHMHAEYCDRPYSWDVDFREGVEPKILVFGNSFGRDWANILYEYDESLNISYKYYYTKEAVSEVRSRIEEADFVFFAMHGGGTEIPKEILLNVPTEKLYIIGNKNYGESNGIVYANRRASNYYDQEIQLSDDIVNDDAVLSNELGDHYISMIQPVMHDGWIRVFTDDNKYISQDCMHLTQSGAQYYSRILNLKTLLSK